jgi:hypothetical protein
VVQKYEKIKIGAYLLIMVGDKKFEISSITLLGHIG